MYSGCQHFQAQDVSGASWRTRPRAQILCRVLSEAREVPLLGIPLSLTSQRRDFVQVSLSNARQSFGLSHCRGGCPHTPHLHRERDLCIIP